MAAGVLLLQVQSPMIDLFARLAADLSAGNAPSFLRHFDKSMPGYGALAAQVNALVEQADASSSLEVARDEGVERSRQVEIDWILDVTGKGAAAPTERRHQTVKCRLELRGQRWIVTSLEPIEFFAPPRDSGR